MSTITRDEAVEYLTKELAMCERPIFVGVDLILGQGPATEENVRRFERRATILRMAIASLLTGPE